jgi:glycerol-3-phosphate dehydrogenase
MKGTVVYYDGQMNDARLNVGLALTAALAGAAVLNHAEVVSFLKDEVGERIIGARIRDNLSGTQSTSFPRLTLSWRYLSPYC